MNTTLLNFRVTNQVKDDFMTICKLNCTSMTSEIVRFMNRYISDESKRFKSYQIESMEINNLKKQRLNQPIYKTHGRTNYD
ncbi:hypothetical protein [uncultured Gammaproteobacteria bacterium]|nr:hypothetical protein [uncultured Gammaproteobacteria bacterium]CAC9954081.1 hypothetical protein [uncultured Gammaproteobacteria bacterium]SHN90825.1 hypothetical protein BHECKSOX_986 [Bathymodiolus heckerae thiotrophic gill symbiont]